MEEPLLHMLQRRLHWSVPTQTFQPPYSAAANPMVTSGGTHAFLPLMFRISHVRVNLHAAIKTCGMQWEQNLFR